MLASFALEGSAVDEQDRQQIKEFSQNAWHQMH